MVYEIGFPTFILTHTLWETTGKKDFRGFLVGGFNHLEKDESQWEGWQPIYEILWNGKYHSCLGNHQPAFIDLQKREAKQQKSRQISHPDSPKQILAARQMLCLEASKHGTVLLGRNLGSNGEFHDFTVEKGYNSSWIYGLWLVYHIFRNTMYCKYVYIYHIYIHIHIIMNNISVEVHRNSL